MSAYVELEIQNLLNEISDLDLIAEKLILHLESSPEQLTTENVLALARFLLKSQSPAQLISFVTRHLEDENIPIPWAYFLEALAQLGLTLDSYTLKALAEGLEETQGYDQAARAPHAPDLPELQEQRSARRYKVHKNYLGNKKNLLEQLLTFRTQQLFEQEKNLLQRLLKLYPGDKEILLELSEFKQRNALEVLQKKSPKNRILKLDDFTVKDPEIEKCLQAVTLSFIAEAKKNPDLAMDFAVALFMLENPQGALQVLQYQQEQTPAFLWLRLEFLLRCRRYVEVLNEISQMEILFAQESETFFATAYLRAQALWGLGQKHTAIEVLEGVLASRPDYRAANALLSIWSSQ